MHLQNRCVIRRGGNEFVSTDPVESTPTTAASELVCGSSVVRYFERSHVWTGCQSGKVLSFLGALRSENWNHAPNNYSLYVLTLDTKNLKTADVG
jgi:hypothetical protein